MRRRPARTITLESLEGRLALSATPVLNPLESLVTARAGPALGEIYDQYTSDIQGGSRGAFTSSLSGVVRTDGPTVEVDIRLSGNFQTADADMQAIGLAETGTVPSIGLVEGFLPIDQLPTVAGDPSLVAVNPSYVPSRNLIKSPLADPIATLPTSPSTPAPTTTSGQVAIIDGFVPIANRTAVAGNAGLVDLSPVEKPSLNN